LDLVTVALIRRNRAYQLGGFGSKFLGADTPRIACEMKLCVFDNNLFALSMDAKEFRAAIP
jgi:hypothetical protein